MLLSRRAIAPTLNLIEPDGTRYDYEAFIRLIQFWRGWLDTQDLSVGDTVMILMPHTAETLALKIACFEAGLIIMALTYFGFHKIERYRRLDIKAVFTRSYIIDMVESEGGYPADLIELPEHIDYDEVPFDPVGEIVATPDSFALKALTSGTTGEPVDVLHTHRTMALAAQSAQELFFKPEDKVSFFMNMNHLGSVSTFTLPVIFGGCQIHVCHYNSETQVIDNLKRDKVNKLLMFPWFWFVLLEVYKANGGTEPLLSDVDLILTGGEPLSSEFLDSLMSHGADVVCSAYGATEAPPPVIVRSIYREGFDRQNYDANHIYQYIGEPVGNWQVEVKDSLIRLKGDSIGYDVDGNPLVESDGFLTTQDVGEMIGTQVYYGGRKSNIKRNGQTIFLSDMDVLVSQKFGGPKLTGAAYLLLAEHAEESGKTTIILVVNRAYLKRNGITFDLSLDDMNSYLTAGLSADHAIDHIVYEDLFPSNDLKADRAALRKKYSDLLTGGES